MQHNIAQPITPIIIRLGEAAPKGPEALLDSRRTISVESNIKEMLYSPYYDREHPYDSGWARLKTVLDLIEEILKTKDASHNLPRHSSYE